MGAAHQAPRSEAGITDEEIAQRIGAEPATGAAALLIRQSTSSPTTATLSDETYQALAAEFDQRQLISLVFLVGTYSMLSMAFSAFRLELESGLTRDLDPEDFDAYART